MISSTRNARVRDLRRLRQQRGDRALLEGPKLLGEALACGVTVETVLATPTFAASPAGARLAASQPALRFEAVSPAVVDSLCDADSPRGVVAAALLPRGGVVTLPRSSQLPYVYVDGLQDPGNLGAIARSAEAAGAIGLILAPGCCHPNHPRALRASAGSLLRLPVALGVTVAEVDQHLHDLRLPWLALTPHGAHDLFSAELPTGLVVAIGAEGAGLSAQVEARADFRITIPLRAPVESLNAAVALGVTLFELGRRRARPSALSSLAPP